MSTPKILYTCASCRWWVAGKRLTNGQALPGQCRRNPPIPIPGGTRWPSTETGDWCGEHSGVVAAVTQVQHVDSVTLSSEATAPDAGQLADEAGVSAVLRTGGAEPDGALGVKLAPAEAESPRSTKPAALERSARRR